MKYLLPLVALFATGCKKTSCYTCTTTITATGNPDTTTLNQEFCHYTEADARAAEARDSRVETTGINGRRVTTMKCVQQ